MKLLLLLLPLVISANEDFISHYEYGQMLYNNPRGVSCSECHGESGKGKLIISYKEGNIEKRIEGSNIRNKTFLDMVRSVNKYHDIMPRYYLTNKEVKAIHDYIQEQK